MYRSVVGRNYHVSRFFSCRSLLSNNKLTQRCYHAALVRPHFSSPYSHPLMLTTFLFYHYHRQPRGHRCNTKPRHSARMYIRPPSCLSRRASNRIYRPTISISNLVVFLSLFCVHCRIHPSPGTRVRVDLWTYCPRRLCHTHTHTHTPSLSFSFPILSWTTFHRLSNYLRYNSKLNTPFFFKFEFIFRSACNKLHKDTVPASEKFPIGIM